MSLFLKSCPKCKGDVYQAHKSMESFTDTLYCLQCGCRPGISPLVKTTDSLKAGPEVKTMLVQFFSFILYNSNRATESADRVIELVNVVNQDLYTATAAVQLNTPTKEVTKLQRLNIKNLIYKFIYETPPKRIEEWIMSS